MGEPGRAAGGLLAPLPDDPSGDPSGGGAGADRAAPRRREDRLVLATLAALPTGTVVVGPDGALLHANRAAVALRAVDGDRLAVPALERLVQQVRERGGEHEEVVQLPHQVQRPLRRPRRGAPAPEARARAVPLPEPGCVALLLEDVTEQRRVDAVRRDFVANVSHELKTPVGALQLLAEAVAESPDDPETVRRFAARMTTEARRLADLVQELIDLSRLQGAEPMEAREEVAVAGVVAEAVDRVRLAAESRGTEVEVRGDPSGLSSLVTGDPRQLVTAVANLLDNAVAYSPSGTRVTVGLVARDGFVEVSVADEGVGIAPQDQERVFERFYRVDPARSRLTGGTGLGLSIVKHVATNHGGTVSLWSREGAGSTFTLRLPLADAEPPGTPRRTTQ